MEYFPVRIMRFPNLIQDYTKYLLRGHHSVGTVSWLQNVILVVTLNFNTDNCMKFGLLRRYTPYQLVLLIKRLSLNTFCD